MDENNSKWVRAAALCELKETDRIVAQVGNRVVLVVRTAAGHLRAIDNRCPHMGFPLGRGSVNDCILTCHWHHARFDLNTGGTFDQWADDVPSFPVEVRSDEVWIDIADHESVPEHHRERLNVGLERNIPLVIAKSSISLSGARDHNGGSAFLVGLEFGTKYRGDGWGAGLTIHTCMANLSAYLDPQDRPLAVYHGLSAVARECNGAPPRFGVRPLPNSVGNADQLKRWFRQFIDVRDEEGAERCITSALRSGVGKERIADMLFAAATDHRYIDGGHSLDFTIKALEALDIVGWQLAEQVISSLIAGFARASRMEESNAWRHPIDLVEQLNRVFEQLPMSLHTLRNNRSDQQEDLNLMAILLGDDPQVILDTLLSSLRDGDSPERLAAAVTRAAILRIAQFPVSNEFSDWDTAHHTFTFANAVHQGLQRTMSPELVRGIFDAAISVYLNRFLNVPAARLPQQEQSSSAPESLLEKLPDLFDCQQRVDESAELVATYLAAKGDPDKLLAVIGRLLLREDRNFHTIQMIEAAFRQYTLRRGTPAATEALIAAVRYLAAHAPTSRAQFQSYEIARRLHRGEHLFGEHG